MAGIGDMVGGLLGGGSDGNNSLLPALMDLIQKRGGVQSVLSQLQSGPLGDAVTSWISTGPNKSVSAHDVGAAFSHDSLSQLSQESGMPREEVKSGLAAQLPDLIDKITPGGSLGSSDQLAGLASNIPGLGRLLG